MSKTFVFFGLMFSIFVHGKKEENLEGCHISTTHEDSSMTTFYLKAFDHNEPKQNELFRLKWYFNGISPAISIAEDEQQLVFGYNHKDADHFGIYLTHEDWMNAENACHSDLTKKVFREGADTEIDTFLEKGLVLFYVHLLN